MIPQHGRLELSASALRHNVALLRRRLGDVALCATLKADAYGHGVDLLAPLLADMGVTWACAYSLPEGLALARQARMRVLVLAPVVMPSGSSPDDVRALLASAGEPVRLTVTDAVSARNLAASLSAAGAPNPWPVHVQVDAGLTRAGAAPADAAALARLVADLPALRLEGIFAHLSHGDVPGDATLARQFAALQRVAAPGKAERPDLIVHLQNSGGAFNVATAGLDMARVGIALYGLQPALESPVPGLRPVARVVAPILSVHERPAGTGVGYGHTFVTARSSRLAVVPVGYGDGYPRALSNRGVAQVGGSGRTVPLVGRVSMDQLVFDITDTDAGVGDEVTVISDDPAAPNCVDRIAAATGTIGYEVATGLGARLERRVVA